jgi:hypothetical protein
MCFFTISAPILYQTTQTAMNFTDANQVLFLKIGSFFSCQYKLLFFFNLGATQVIWDTFQTLHNPVTF